MQLLSPRQVCILAWEGATGKPPVTGMLTLMQRFTVCDVCAEHDGAMTGPLAAGEGLPAPEELSAVMASPTQHQLPMPASSRGISAASPGAHPILPPQVPQRYMSPGTGDVKAKRHGMGSQSSLCPVLRVCRQHDECDSIGIQNTLRTAQHVTLSLADDASCSV